MAARQPRATIDFETRSACSIKRGPWLYSRHPSTQAMCLAYLLPGMDPDEPRLWHAAFPAADIEATDPPDDLLEWIERGGILEGHNSFFERMIWKHVVVPQFKWPAIGEDQWLCSMAKASSLSLPRDLGGAGRVMNLKQTKDEDGHKHMLRYTSPLKPNAEERKWAKAMGEAPPIKFLEDDGLHKVFEYCRQDVRSEHALSEATPDLIPQELKVWRMDQAINQRGVTIDLDMARKALAMTDAAKEKMNAECRELTGFKASQRGSIKEWLRTAEDLWLPDTQYKTIETFHRRKVKMSARARRVLDLVRRVNRTSTAKYKQMILGVDLDQRARDLLVYCGADRTGRWAGRNIQVQNLPRGEINPDAAFPWNVTMEEACADILTGDLEWCEALYGDVMALLSYALRGALMATPGKEFVGADYSAIEAWLLLWEAGSKAIRKPFPPGEDLYTDMASKVYSRHVTKKDKRERWFGKWGVLSLGYGMGFIKFLWTLRRIDASFSKAEVLQAMGREKMAEYEAKVRAKLFAPKDADASVKRECARNRERITMYNEEPEEVVHELALMMYATEVYRTAYPEVPIFWRALENASISAVLKPGKAFRAGTTLWKLEGRFLKCRLPSGRCLNYIDPRVRKQVTPWGEARRALSYMGTDQLTRQWNSIPTYGGKLAENVTQATARDIMAHHGMLNVEAEGSMDLLFSNHDEEVCEVPLGSGDPDLLRALMTDLPDAYKGCPITAEADVFMRYRKG